MRFVMVFVMVFLFGVSEIARAQSDPVVEPVQEVSAPAADGVFDDFLIAAGFVFFIATVGVVLVTHIISAAQGKTLNILVGSMEKLADAVTGLVQSPAGVRMDAQFNSLTPERQQLVQGLVDLATRLAEAVPGSDDDKIIAALRPLVDGKAGVLPPSDTSAGAVGA